MTWPTDKLGVINDALIINGESLVQVADDGSDEWLAGSAAYESAIEYMYESHDWKGITQIGTLTKVGPPANPVPADTAYTDAYAKPDNCAHLIYVRVDNWPSPYIIVGNQIWLNSYGSAAVTAKYVVREQGTTDPASGRLTPMFLSALKLFVRAGIYSSRELFQQEQACLQEGRRILMEAKTRSDQEQPGRNIVNSRILRARRYRRPRPVIWDGGDGHW